MKRIKLLLVLSFCTGIISCESNSDQSKKEEKQTAPKVKKQYKVLDSGVSYRLLRQGHGEQIENGKTVVANVAAYANEKVFLNTWNKSGFEFIEVTEHAEPRGLMEALRIFKIGTVAEIIVPVECGCGYTKEVKPELAGKELKYRVELMQLDKTVQKLDTAGLKSKVIGSGITLFMHKKGTGKAVKPGEKVKVHYLGYLESGEIFDNSYQKNKPIEIEVGVTSVIMGWQEVLASSNRGDKITVVIPSYLAYGQEGKPGRIPANANLVFDMEILR